MLIGKGAPLGNGLPIMGSLLEPMPHIMGLSSSFTEHGGDPEAKRPNISEGSVLIFRSSCE